ncbi:hypothetical protein ROA7745_03598 [Roseovarius aestuarii]|uniref:Uncharacterized protein n=1 Tax=Roseovarius aestuarii TaxID=475083 RepID=A0A1X7BX06_9RHOB|nr:hypothetical protein ROA7745_03598 [Roseovarius aestuarii]
MIDINTNSLTNTARTTRVKNVIPAIDLQSRRIRRTTGVSAATARNIALLAFGERV